MTTAVTAASGWARPGSRVTAANGTEAPTRTIAITTWRTSQPGSPTSVPTIVGAPTAVAIPPASASTPPAIATGTSGTTARLTAGETRESRPNVASTSGSVAA